MRIADVVQDVSGGSPVMVEGTDGQLYGMEVDVEAAKAELREIASKDQGKGGTDFLKNVGLGAFADQLQDLKLGATFNPSSGGCAAVMHTLICWPAKLLCSCICQAKTAKTWNFPCDVLLQENLAA